MEVFLLRISRVYSVMKFGQTEVPAVGVGVSKDHRGLRLIESSIPGIRGKYVVRIWAGIIDTNKVSPGKRNVTRMFSLRSARPLLPKPYHTQTRPFLLH